MRALLYLASLLYGMTAFAGGLPAFQDDLAADRWLRETSPFFRMMAVAVDGRGGYQIRSAVLPFKGNVMMEGSHRFIELNKNVTGDERVSILIFEMTNAYQAPKHEAIDADAFSGRIKNAREFGFWHEMVELDGLRLHRKVLVELDRAVGGISPAMLHWINPKLNSLQDYEVPLTYEYMQSMDTSGHMQHYRDWFAVESGQSKTPVRK